MTSKQPMPRQVELSPIVTTGEIRFFLPAQTDCVFPFFRTERQKVGRKLLNGPEGDRANMGFNASILRKS
jgi:hypothetical protein